MHERVLPDNTVIFVCDIQEKWMTLFSNPELLAFNGNLLIQSAEKLGVPVLVTEHYKKAFGPTTDKLPALKGEALNVKYFEKQLFSMVTDEVTQYLLDNPLIRNVILFGLETHVCVLQTAIDLTHLEKQVYVVADAVFSRREYDRKIALERLPLEGVLLTTTESIVLQMVQSADNEVFRGDKVKKDGILSLLRVDPPEMK